jgi:hydroxypyruvate reductase
VTAPSGQLRTLWAELGPRLDGGRLVEAAAAGDRFVDRFVDGPGPLAVLALGKAAPAMAAGLVRARGPVRLARGLVITTAGAPQVALPTTLARLTGEHPLPGDGSVHAARAADALCARLRPPARLLVLLSGGGSALLAAPAAGLSLEDKRRCTAAVARAGASIFELNAVRKHLSSIKGGQLGAATQVPVRVLALSDVVGDDPATIASGPFCADPTRFADALRIVDDLVPPTGQLASARAHLARGAAGALPETPKPGDPRLAAIEHQILAGPGRVGAEARALIEGRGLPAGLLSRDIEAPVAALAQAYAERAAEERAAGGPPRVLIGNGEPRIELPARPGRGGRCTHLALLVARSIAGLAGVAFLAAVTDDRDGNSPAAGAVVDGQTWPRAVAEGLDPEQALLGFDSAGPLEALGCLLPPHGTSNLLDLHLMAVD